MSDRAAESVRRHTITYSTPGDLATVRHFVRREAAELGLPAERVELLVLAVSELATNTLQHTSGDGRVGLWVDGDHLVCEVVDRGPPRFFGDMPSSDAVRGRGLAIVSRVADEVASEADGDGTAVRIRMSLVRSG